MALNDDILNAQVGHAIGLQRLATGILRRILALLNRTDTDIEGQIRERLAGFEPGTVESDATIVRLNDLLAALHETGTRIADEVQVRLIAESLGLAAYEVEYQAATIDDLSPVSLSLGRPSPETLQAIVLKRPFQGRVLREWAQGIGSDRTRRISDAIRIGMVEGESVDRIVRRVRGTRAMGFKDGILEISRRDAEAVVRTAVTHVATGAADAFYKANAETLKGVKWVSVLDSRTTPVCQARDGTVYPVGKGPRPPAHFRCLPGDTLVTARHGVSGASKRRYDGDLIVIRTAAGKELACTPNHPILTSTGWVAAGLLHVGGDVVCDGGAEWSAAAVDMDHQHVPACIEDVAQATFRSIKMRTRPVPTAAEDFHGDGIDGEIAVVATERFLADGREAPLAEESGQRALIVGNVNLASLAGSGDFGPLVVGMDPSTSGRVGCRSQSLSLRQSGPTHPGTLLVGSVPGCQSDALHGPDDRGRDRAEPFGDGPYADTFVVHSPDQFDVNVDAGRPRRAPRLSGFAESSQDGVAADAELASEILAGCAGPVFLDEITHVERRDFRGHVFNLETGKGFYTASGIITHNCRSTVTPVVKSYRDLGIDLDDLPEPVRQSVNGQEPAGITYGQWLAKQSAATQDDILGPTKGRLFRDGGLTVDRFVDRAGHAYTLDELRRRESRAFKAAGLAA